MNVPFVDLKTQYTALEEEVREAIHEVCRNASFVFGDDVSAFEEEFAGFTGARRCVGVASGCDALLWALRALGVGPGDEVITVANTFVATVFAISHTGARPVLVDCRADTYLIDAEQVERAITPRTRAIVAVHLYGQAADMDALGDMAERHGLALMEDAAQAHGATFGGRPCGSLGHIGCFSFYPGKNLGAYGDGGAVTTDDDALADFVEQAGNYGQTQKYHHDMLGWNSRLDTVQAAVLRIKLRRLPAWNEARRRHAAAYRDRLADLPLGLPREAPGNRHVYHLFVVHHHERDAILEYLKAAGIVCGIHYPVPIHRMKAYRDLGYRRGDLPVSERLADEIFSLPMYPEMTGAQVAYVCETLRGWFQDGEIAVPAPVAEAVWV